MPEISVLIPAFNAAATVAETLACLAAQTHADFEVVLIDDGSSDGTAEVARRALADARLRVVSPGRVGLIAALNLGLEHCRAPLVARLDADDLCAEDRLERQLAAMHASPEVGVLGSGVRSFRDVDESGGAPGGGFARYDAWQNSLCDDADIRRERFIESPLVHPSVVYRRPIVLSLGGYRDMGWPEDYDLWLRALEAGVRIAKVPEILLHWRDHGGRATRVDGRYSERAVARCKAHFLARGPLRGRGAVLVGGVRAGKLGAMLEKEGVTIRAYVDADRRRRGSARRGVPILGPEALPDLRGSVVLAAVGTPGARDDIRRVVQSAGFREGEDFYCVA